MKLSQLKKKKIPDAPGVYIFKRAKKILYIGRASSLKNRVRSYFDKDILETRGELITQMVASATSIKTIPTESVLEAIFLEAHLIKKYQPVANTREKSNKSFAAIIITKEKFPRVLLVRERDVVTGKIPAATIAYQFGPFLSKAIIRDALKIIRRIFPYRDICIPMQGKPCFNRQIGLCPGVCTGETSPLAYKKTIRSLKLFFEGKKQILTRLLKKEMAAAAKGHLFEKADQIKRQLASIGHIQDVGLMKRDVLVRHSGFRIEAYDVAHLAGGSQVGVMTVVEGGVPERGEYRKFRIKTVSGPDDTKALSEILSRRLTHTEWQYPRLIVVDGGKAQVNAALRVLREAGVLIPVVGVVKDETHRPRSIIGSEPHKKEHEQSIVLANSEAHRFAITFHRQLERKVFLR